MDTILLIAFVLVLYFVITSITKYSEALYIESDVDNFKYLIRRGNIKSNEYLKESANTLGELNSRVMKLIEHLEEKYEDAPDKQYYIKKLRTNYGPNILSEAAIDNRYTTYTIDKKDMHICLRTRDTNEKIYDINLLMYVILHELAHLCNYNIHGEAIQGHGEEFKMIFKLLVIEAIKIGIYRYDNYYNAPQEYCGIVISTTILPYYQINF